MQLSAAVDSYDKPYGTVSVLEFSEQLLDVLPSAGVLYTGRRFFLASACESRVNREI